MSNPLASFEKLVSSIPNAELGNLFGKPCGKIDKKAFVAFFEEEMVFKVGRTANEALLKKYKGSQLFDPSGKGRPMKDWLQVPSSYSKDWKKLAELAREFCFG